MNITKEINGLKKAVEKLKEKLLLLEEKIEERENTFNNRSEKWQESEKGELFNDVSEGLQYKFNEMESKIENIEGCIETLQELF